MPSNNMDTITINVAGEQQDYCLMHIYNLQITIPNFAFEDGRIDTVTIHVRPTNHVYSRALEKQKDDMDKLKKSGHLLLKYEHIPSDPTQETPNKTLSSDIRVFCPEKYQASLLLTDFVQALNTHPKNICALANKGDDRTCLSALFKAQSDSRFYVVLFRFHKKANNEASMVIETAFLAEEDDFRVKMLKNPKNKPNTRPFLILLRNIFAGRRPFEGRSTPKKRSRRKTQKKKP